MDLHSAGSMVGTLSLTMIMVIFLTKPFFSTENDKCLNKDEDSGDEAARATEAAHLKETILDSLEELEIAMKTGDLSQEEYEEQKRIILEDASSMIEG